MYFAMQLELSNATFEFSRGLFSAAFDPDFGCYSRSTSELDSLALAIPPPLSAFELQTGVNILEK